MCGITGAIWTDPEKALENSTLHRMTAALRHRGPDDEGYYCSDIEVRPGYGRLPGVALGHRRLSIIDVAGGRQPMANEDGSIWIVLNGEIYNFRELRGRLEGQGHRFQTQSDTETLVHLYEDEGLAMLEHVEGMFAFALWDARQGQLLLARDRLGKKPLVYRQESGRLLFASELKSLLEVPGVPREIDPQALDEYLTYQYVPHPRTIYRGIHKLSPGQYAIYREGRLTVQPYWQPDFQAEEDRPAADYAAELRQRMTSAVELRLQSEVPLGAFLSGGIDSTIVVGLMRQLVGGPVRTFSIGFPVPEYDETHFARLAARRFETLHEEFRVEPRAIEILPKLVWHYDEPLAGQFGRADLVRGPTHPASRHRSPDRRRWRRTVCRLSALPGRVAGRRAGPIACRSPLGLVEPMLAEAPGQRPAEIAIASLEAVRGRAASLARATLLAVDLHFQ